MKTAIAVAAALVVLVLLVAHRGRASADAAQVMRELRERALTTSASDFGIKPESGAAWGVVMDTTYPDASASLVAFADGSTSLYFSTGGGVIGGGEHANVNAAARRFVKQATLHLARLRPATDRTLPAQGQTRFYVRTEAGLLTATAPEQQLGDGRHELSPLFHAGQEVITQLRLISEQGK